MHLYSAPTAKEAGNVPPPADPVNVPTPLATPQVVPRTLPLTEVMFEYALSVSPVRLSVSSHPPDGHPVLSLVFLTSTVKFAVAQPAVRLGLPRPLVTVAALGASTGVTVTEFEVDGPKLPPDPEPEALAVSVTVATAGSPYLCAVKVQVAESPALMVVGVHPLFESPVNDPAPRMVP